MNRAAVISGLFFFLILISIGNLSTTEASRPIILLVRYISIAIVVYAVVIQFLLGNTYFKQYVAAGLYLSLIAYGITLSALNGALEVGAQYVFINPLVTLSGLVLIGAQTDKVLPDRISKFYLWYVLFALCITVAIGGLDYAFPPHFVFEHSSELIASDVLYSQGISQFFGFGAITAAYMLSKSSSTYLGLLLLVIVVLMLALSFLGGARGDSVAAAIVTLGYLAIRFRMRFFFPVLMMGIMLISYVEDWSTLLDNFQIFQRLLELLDGYYGRRDLLMGQVLNVLSLEPRCLVTGCGFGFFQKFYGYEFGLYPHNFIAESIIVFGLPISAIFGVLVLDGMRDYYHRVQSIDLFLLFFALSVLAAMKSGSLFGGWFITAASMYFAANSYSRLTRRSFKGIRHGAMQ